MTITILLVLLLVLLLGLSKKQDQYSIENEADDEDEKEKKYFRRPATARRGGGKWIMADWRTVTSNLLHPRRKAAGVVLLLVALAISASATEPTKAAPAAALPWLQSFEQQLPGESPVGWSYRWGQPGDDLISISNIEAVDGQHALLLDRTLGTKATISGFGTAIPDIRDGTVVLTVHLLYTGPGNNAHFGLLIRDSKGPHTVVAAIQSGDQELAFSGTAYHGKGDLGAFREKRWYRVRLWLPTGGAKDTTNARAALWEMTAAGVFTPAGKEVALDTVQAPAAYGIIELVTGPEKRDYRLYLDALSVTRE